MTDFNIANLREDFEGRHLVGCACLHTQGACDCHHGPECQRARAALALTKEPTR